MGYNLNNLRYALAILFCLVLPGLSRADERAAARLYNELRAADRLEPFLRVFPKGGDLHNHLGGDITPQQWIEIAIKRSFCVEEAATVLVQNLAPACPPGMSPAATLRNDGPLYEKFVDAMSMRDRAGRSRGHDWFFGPSGGASGHVRMTSPEMVRGDMIEAVVLHAHEQNISHLELQIGLLGNGDLAKFAALLPAEGSLAEWLVALEKSQVFRDAVEQNRQLVQLYERELLERRPTEAAAVRRGYLITAGRGLLPQGLLAQLAVAAELARVEPHVVGVNMAGAEDNPISLRNFRAQMRTIDFMLARKPWLRVTLHAGEMTPQILGAAPGAVPEALTYHIAESVWNGHAERIGHGTALRYEKDRSELLRNMRERGVLVEICLTSDELIQGLKPDEIPFAAYRQAGVPVSLNTDDEGPFGSDLSHEFLRAARDYKLGYLDLKELARNSIEYSFLPGHSLFRTRQFTAWVPACQAAIGGEDLPWPAYRERFGPDCRAYLDSNPKADAQARLEHQFQQFESSASLLRFERSRNQSERR